MKISLLYNADAGDGVSVETLRREFERAGHELVQVVGPDTPLHKLVEEPADVVVAAGGDGTIVRAASVLIGETVPLAILPLGTANNIGRSLGVCGPIRDLIGNWERARILPLDLGLVRGAWGESPFLESVGTGLISRGIAAPAAQSAPDETGRSRKLERALRVYREILRELKARRWSLTVDGTASTGDFLLIEVLNIGTIGPNFVLSPDANPSDGWLDLVIAGEEHRRELDEYLRCRIERKDGRLSLPTRRIRQLDIEGLDELHVNGEPRSAAPPARLSIRVEAAAVRLLV